MQTRIQVNTTGAPAAFGPFSQAIKTDTLVFTSGQLPIDPESGELVAEDVIAQTHQVFKNLKTILEEAGCLVDGDLMDVGHGAACGGRNTAFWDAHHRPSTRRAQRAAPARGEVTSAS